MAETEILKIVLKVGGTALELSVEEAYSLKKTLNDIFPDKGAVVAPATGWGCGCQL